MPKITSAVMLRSLLSSRRNRFGVSFTPLSITPQKSPEMVWRFVYATEVTPRVEQNTRTRKYEAELDNVNISKKKSICACLTQPYHLTHALKSEDAVKTRLDELCSNLPGELFSDHPGSLGSHWAEEWCDA